MAEESAQIPIPIRTVKDGSRTSLPFSLLHSIPSQVQPVRATHATLGVLMGTLPQLSQQNTFLGTPMMLSLEEAAALGVEGSCRFMDDANSYRPPTLNESKSYHLSRQKDIKIQQQSAVQKQKEHAKLSISARKNQKNSQRQNRVLSERPIPHQDNNDGGVFENDDDEDIVPEKDEGNGKKEEPEEKEADLDKFSYRIIIPASMDQLPNSTWYQPHYFLSPSSSSTRSPSQILGALSSSSSPTTTNNSPDSISVLPYPLSRLCVFLDLRKRGYWLASSGLKFGGDFTAYPGDPLRYHSHFIVTIVQEEQQRIPLTLDNNSLDGKEEGTKGEEGSSSIDMRDILAWGRLATGVKKSHLLASFKDEDKEIDYFTITWSGFG